VNVTKAREVTTVITYLSPAQGLHYQYQNRYTPARLSMIRPPSLTTHVAIQVLFECILESEPIAGASLSDLVLSSFENTAAHHDRTTVQCSISKPHHLGRPLIGGMHKIVTDIPVLRISPLRFDQHPDNCRPAVQPLAQGFSRTS